MSRLTRDGTAEPVSRDQILRHVRGQGNIKFPCSAGHERDWQPYPVDSYSAICDDHTYIHPRGTYILQNINMFLHVLSRMYSSSSTFYAQNPALEIVHQQKSVNVYLHIHTCTKGMFSRSTLYAQHPVSLRTPLPGSRLRASSRLYAKNSVFKIVHEKSVKVYHLHMHVQREYLAEPSMRRINPVSLRNFPSLSGSRLRFFIAMSFHYSYEHVICEHHASGRAVLLFYVRILPFF